MIKKKQLAWISFLLVGVLGYLLTSEVSFVVPEKGVHKDSFQVVDIKSTATVSTASSSSYTQQDFVWKSDVLPDKDGVPYEKISLHVRGEVYPLGMYSGCSLSEKLVETSEPISVIGCWFAGGGYDLAVFKEQDVYVIKKLFTQETGDEAGVVPFGPWEKIGEIR
jgi:hypothetical protein